MGLFRAQAVEAQSNKLHGDVIVMPKLSHAVICIFLLVWLVLVVWYLLSSNYARKESVLGWLEPKNGIVRVYAENEGKVAKLLVEEGELVVEGQPLIVVNGDRILADGVHLETLLLDEFKRKKIRLQQQLLRLNEIDAVKRNDIAQRISLAKQELDWADRQLKTLESRAVLIGKRLQRHRSLNKQGYITAAEVESVLDQELSLESERQELSRRRISQQSLLNQLIAEKTLLPDEAENTADRIRSGLSDLSQDIARLRGRRAYVLKASRSGVVTNIQVREGQWAKTSVPLMSLVSIDDELIINILVPVRASGFVESGQNLTIRYDAFPYQKFGLYQGKVLNMSASLILPNEFNAVPFDIREPVYKVMATVDNSYITAYGKQIALKAGMTLSADITLEQRSLLQWLLEPVLSLRGRL